MNYWIFFLILLLDTKLFCRDPFSLSSDEKVIIQDVNQATVDGDTSNVSKRIILDEKNDKADVLYEDKYQKIVRSPSGSVNKICFPE